jgi:hypothetical protein
MTPDLDEIDGDHRETCLTRKGATFEKCRYKFKSQDKSPATRQLVYPLWKVLLARPPRHRYTNSFASPSESSSLP